MSLRDQLMLLMQGFFLPFVILSMIRAINREPIDPVYLAMGALSVIIGLWIVLDIVNRARGHK